jgi:hypothetical protein
MCRWQAGHSRLLWTAGALTMILSVTASAALAQSGGSSGVIHGD